MSKLLLLPLAAALACSTGCATLLAPKTDTLAVFSNPPGAQVLVDGAPQGVTPAQIVIEKKHPPTVVVGMPGFVQQSCPVILGIGTDYAVADAALCVLLFPLGCVALVDATGAWNELEKDTCAVNLQPDPGGDPQQAFPQQGYPPQASPQQAPPPQADPQQQPSPSPSPPSR